MILIEDYYKWLSKRTKYFKSPTLNLSREGFFPLEIVERDKGEKSLDIIKLCLESRKIINGHVVYRILKDGWGGFLMFKLIITKIFLINMGMK